MSDKEALPVQYGCHCDLEPGMKPDSCVLDMGPAYHSNCTYAPRLVRERKGRDDCEHWQPIKVARADAAAAALAQRDAEIQRLRQAIGTVCEGWTLPDGVRKVLETALWSAPDDTSAG